MTTYYKTRHTGLYTLEDGRYRVRTTAQCPRTGKMRERKKTLPHGTSQREALAVLRELNAGLRRAMPTPHHQRRRTVADYAEQWLKTKSKRLKASVLEHYISVLSLHILPRLGAVYLDTITRKDVLAWVAWAETTTSPRGKSYAQDTVRGWWRVLSCLLRDAAAELGLPDPTLRVRSPVRCGGQRREKRTLSAAELAELVVAVGRLQPQRHAEVMTLAYTGLRAGELYALRWQDLDLSRLRITVHASVWKGHLGRTKTGDPREVPIPRQVADVLAKHRREMIAGQHRGLASGLVFPSNRGGYRQANALTKPLAQAALAAGITQRVTAQVLRRTFNTLLVRANVDRIVLRSIMGHSSEEMTERYAGISLQDKQAAVDQLFEGRHVP